MKYQVWTVSETNETMEHETNDKVEALKFADRCRGEVREYVNDTDYDLIRRYEIRYKESGNMIEEYDDIDEAKEELTSYVLNDERDSEDLEERDIYIIQERRERLLGFYEIYDRLREEVTSIYWDINDDCVY